MTSLFPVLLALVLASDPSEAPVWLRLDGPANQIQQKGETCPIRLELPLPEIQAKETGTRRTGKAAGVPCKGARLTVMVLEWGPPRMGQTRTTSASGSRSLSIKSTITLAKGRDRDFDLRFWLLQGDKEIAADTEYLYGDEGEANWGDGVVLWIPGKSIDPTGPPPVLRVELEVNNPTR